MSSAALCAPEDVRNRRLDPALTATDELAKRWAKLDRPAAAMHPLEAMRLLKDGAVLGGESQTMADDLLGFDQCFAASPARERAVITVWYKTGGSALQKAARLEISRTMLYSEWSRTLSYFRGWLRSHGLDV